LSLSIHRTCLTLAGHLRILSIPMEIDQVTSLL
jgi:hypothetical protein